MALKPLPLGGRAAYLVLQTIPTRVALPAKNIVGVTRKAEDLLETPVDLAALLPVHFVQSAPVSVVTLDSNAQVVAILVSGPVHIEHYADEAMLDMPDMDAPGFRFYSGVALADGKASALVVNIDALLGVRRELDR